MNRLRAPLTNFGLAILSGLLLVLVFPRYNFVWLAPFALAPLLYALAREPRPLRRFLLGWLAGVVYWFGICNWIQFVLEVHGGMGRWGGWGTFLLFCILKALHLGVFALLAAIVLPHAYAIPAIAALWVGIERTHAPLGFAWLALGNAGIDLGVPLHLAPWTGVYGLSFLFVLMNAATTVVLLKRGRRQLLWLLLALIPFVLPRVDGGLAAPNETAVLLQPNLPEELDWTTDLERQMHRRLASLSMSSAMSTATPPALIVWPEVPGPIYYYRDPAFRNIAEQLARVTRSYFLFGTVANAPDRAPTNSAVLLRPDGSPVDRYDKINLVPFGEYVPPIFGWVNRVTKEAGDFEPGTRMIVLPEAGHNLGVFICYESAFPHQVRQFVKNGADLLVNLSNDGYFGTSAAREQHLSIVRMRAVENHRWILRDTNDGITAAIDPAGRVAERLPLYTETVARFPFAYERALTPYTRWGDCFAWGCWLPAFAALLLSQRPHYKPRTKRKNSGNHDRSRT